MPTVMYLLRHAATDANLARPATLLGRRLDPPLARKGVRQAELTRDFLGVRAIDHCYCSPMLRALETAKIIAEPHDLVPTPLDGLIECHLGDWEGLDWQTIRTHHADAYKRFMSDPAEFGYPGGESFGDVASRTCPVLDQLLANHTGEAILVVGHHVVNRIYLARVLGLGPGHARQVKLDNCGISVVVRDGEETTVDTLNASFHLQGAAA